MFLAIATLAIAPSKPIRTNKMARRVMIGTPTRPKKIESGFPLPSSEISVTRAKTPIPIQEIAYSTPATRRVTQVLKEKSNSSPKNPLASSFDIGIGLDMLFPLEHSVDTNLALLELLLAKNQLFLGNFESLELGVFEPRDPEDAKEANKELPRPRGC